ncbi:MAG: hypothetical protein J7642_12220 [Cyanobacteria bacterium SBC]|nr:hypothetical protein [Cyanobacteria bacterium SBC]
MAGSDGLLLRRGEFNATSWGLGAVLMLEGFEVSGEEKKNYGESGEERPSEGEKNAEFWLNLGEHRSPLQTSMA